MNLQRKVQAGLRFLRSRFTENSAILLYHRVAEKVRDPFNLCVTPAHFSEQMAVLRQIGDPLPVEDFTRRQREGRLEKRSLCLSFDDGYTDFLENAVPVLEKFEIPAVIYCVTAHPGQPFWWDRLLAILHGSTELPGAFDLRSGNSSDSIPTSGVSREVIFDRLYAHFRYLEPDAREEQLQALEKTAGLSSDIRRPRLMTEDEIKTLSAHPLITIGAHTVSHSSLAGMAPETQYQEIESSKQALEAVTGRPVTSFSYPFGLRQRDYTRETITAVRKAGFDHALTADLGVVTARTDSFSLPRMWIHDLNASRFQQHLNRWI